MKEGLQVMQIDGKITARAEQALEQLEEIHTLMTEKYSAYAVLESKFKTMYVTQYTAALNLGKKTTEAKAAVEAILSLEVEYAEYIKLPIILEGLSKKLRVIEMKLKSLERMAEARRYLK